MVNSCSEKIAELPKLEFCTILEKIIAISYHSTNLYKYSSFKLYNLNTTHYKLYNLNTTNYKLYNFNTTYYKLYNFNTTHYKTLNQIFNATSEFLLHMESVYKNKIHVNLWRSKITSQQFYNTFIKSQYIITFNDVNYTLLN